MKCTHNNFTFRCGVQACPCVCMRLGGWVGTVLARGAQPCVLLCGLPDSRPGCRWRSVSALCSAGTLTQTIGHMDTWAQQMDIHGHANSHVYYMHMHFQLCKNSLIYSEAKSCKIMYNGITFAYSELFSRTVSCWVRQHTLAGVAAAGVLAN